MKHEYQADGKHRLEQQREAYEAGDKVALLAAIRICANHDIPLPKWASCAYIAAYDQVLNCRVGSWDDAFGKPYPGKQLNRLRQRRELMLAVYMRVKELREKNGHYKLQQDGTWKLASDIPIDESLFECIGKEFNIGKTACSELYYDAKKTFPELPQKR